MTGVASGWLGIPRRFLRKKNCVGRKEEKKMLMKDKMMTSNREVMEDRCRGLAEQTQSHIIERKQSVNILKNEKCFHENFGTKQEPRKTGVWIESSFLSR